MKPIWIVSAKRTPQGRFLGGLVKYSAVDLGVRAAMKKAYGLAELPKPEEMEAIAASWHPYRSVASWYLWRSLEN